VPRMLFGWLVTSHVIETKPEHAVGGPITWCRRARRRCCTPDQARALLVAIDTGALTGLRDRALIGVTVYTFARVNAVVGMTVKDDFTQG
jgi:site-specific recombinase XerD